MEQANMPRTGPRPLPLYLATEMAAWSLGRAVLPLFRRGTLPLAPALKDRAAALRARLAPVDDETFLAALDQAGWARFAEFTEGVRRYQNHPYRRNLTPAPVIWQQGSTRLVDYGACAEARGDGVRGTVLLVPSLVNRAYVLDLTAKMSFARDLAARGFRPLLVDWGAPEGVESAYNLEDYILGRLVPALEVAADGRPIAVLGYCMGGLLALAAALQRPDLCAAFVALATPWDFHAEPGQADIAAAFAPFLAPITELWNGLPVDLLQALFASLDPPMIGRKFRYLAGLSPRSARAKGFVALEDWLNDWVPLAKGVAYDCLLGWYVQNTSGRGQWQVGGQVVDPAALRCPALVVVPESDRIVPPASARALADALPEVELRCPATGHIGMMAGGRARETVWQPLALWLQQRSQDAKV